jgi:proteasome lid subunit RPN8/RPN11
MAFRLAVPESVRDAMVAQALAEQPNECCGLLAGVEEMPAGGGVPVGRVTARFPLVNAEASPKRYLSDDRSILDATKAIHEGRLILLAVYHSHPTSEAVPSKTDLKSNFYEDAVVHLIISLATSPPTIRGWRLTATDYREEAWDVIAG